MAGFGSRAAAAAVASAAGIAAVATSRVAGRRIVARTERRLNAVARRPPYNVSEAALELHSSILVADLHADSLLWGRDLLVRSDRGCVDVPRLIEGGVALQAFAASVRVPRHLNLDRNADTSDDVTLLAVAGGWPLRTWRSPLARALHLAERARRMATDSGGRLTIVATRRDLEGYLRRRRVDPAITAGLLTIEGAAPLEGDVANLDLLGQAGYRMLGLAHFVDTPFSGSAHGVGKGGLTDEGRALVRRAETLGIVVDLAHASAATIDDVLAVATWPVVVSHGGLRSAFESVRNLPDEQVRAIAATGGVVGIGFWPAVTGGDDVASIARSIVRAVDVAGVEHVALGSDFDGAVPVPFDASGMALLTEALLAEGLAPDAIAAVMGGNVFRLLEVTLPAS
jgi:membrane dipeptidase